MPHEAPSSFYWLITIAIKIDRDGARSWWCSILMVLDHRNHAWWILPRHWTPWHFCSGWLSFFSFVVALSLSCGSSAELDFSCHAFKFCLKTWQDCYAGVFYCCLWFLDQSSGVDCFCFVFFWIRILPTFYCWLITVLPDSPSLIRWTCVAKQNQLWVVPKKSGECFFWQCHVRQNTVSAFTSIGEAWLLGLIVFIICWFWLGSINLLRDENRFCMNWVMSSKQLY